MTIIIMLLGGICVLTGVSWGSHALAIIGGLGMYAAGFWQRGDYEVVE